MGRSTFEGSSNGRCVAISDRSASFVLALAERTEENVATARIIVPPAVATRRSRPNPAISRISRCLLDPLDRGGLIKRAEHRQGGRIGVGLASSPSPPASRAE
jgi:hypothetical protein